MRKKIKWVVILAVLVLCSFIYAHIDKVTRIYDKNIDTSKYVNMGIRNGVVFEQSFVSCEDIINGIEIMCLSEGDISTAKLSYELIEKETEETVREGDINLEGIESGKFHKISFEELQGCKGRSYCFSIKQEITIENSGVSFYYAPKTEQNTELIMNEQVVDGTAIFRTISHRFDLETFIVLLSFIGYIGIFMSFLIKLFK